VTVDRFLEKLRETPRDWEVNIYGCIRRNRECECPITAVEGVQRCTWYYHESAKALGLSDVDRSAIVAAADSFHTSAEVELRAELLDACGLTERAQTPEAR
jgi:hypothetical protein